MQGRETAVLYAGIAGDGAAMPQHAMRIVETLAHAAKVSGGRVADRARGEAMALFATPDAAAHAALRMQAYAFALPPLPGRMGMRLSLDSGLLAQRGEKVFGETVDRARELLEAAGPGEALVSARAAAALSAGMRRFLAPAEGKAGGRLLLGELLFGNQARLGAWRARRVELRLAYGSKSLVRRREGDSALIGADAACDLVVSEAGASGRHCTILLRRGSYVLRDHSENGTFVLPEGGKEIVVRGEEMALAGRGVVFFGPPAARSGDGVLYRCEG